MESHGPRRKLARPASGEQAGLERVPKRQLIPSDSLSAACREGQRAVVLMLHNEFFSLDVRGNARPCGSMSCDEILVHWICSLCSLRRLDSWVLEE